jgi:uncharacterized Zn finger protein (UPF0148 family)
MKPEIEDDYMLLPCPHCGAPAQFEDGGFNAIRIACSDFDCEQRRRVHKRDKRCHEKLAEHWNYRAQPSLSDAIKEVEKMRDENNRSYEYWKSVSSNPETDLGVLKFVAWAGEDERVITALKSLGPQRED